MKLPARRPELFRASPASVVILALLFLPIAAHAQAAGSPFDTGFIALQNLFTGTIAKVASLIATEHKLVPDNLNERQRMLEFGNGQL
jgi:hypothetical protein